MKIRLGDLTRIKTGKLDANASSSDGEYPFFTCSKEPLKIATYSYDCECVLVAGNGDLNVKYYNGKFDAYQRTYIIEGNDDGKLYIPYLYFFMEKYVEELRKLSIGGVIKYIKLGNLTDAMIELPDMEKQKFIVRLLSKLKGIITQRQQQLQKLDELIKARFVEMFGDPVRNSMGLKTMPLGKACCLKAGITTSADMIHEQSNEFAIPCYGGNGIRGYVESATQCGCYPIIGRQGALCGNVQLAMGKFHATEHAVLVTPLIETNVVWLFYLLKMMDLYRFHTGAAQPGLAVKTLNTVDIPIADVAVQHQFAAFVEQTDKSKIAVQKALDEAQLLFDSLMQKYFG